MSMVTLKYWRLLVPGILLILLFRVVIQDNFSDISKAFTSFQWEDSPSLGLSIIIGALYYIFKIRDPLWNPYHKRVQNNIKDTLIIPLISELDEQQRIYLKDGRKLMNVFYYFVDNDKSLSEKANRVRFNGLFWTSTVDLTIITAFGSLIFWVRLIIETDLFYLWMALILAGLSVASYGLIKLTTKRHISLSNEQLEIILQSHKPALKSRIYDLLGNQ